MRIIVMGQQAFGKDVLEKILNAQVDEIVAVYCEPDKEGRPYDPIKEFALQQGIDVLQPKSFSEKTCVDKFGSFNADLMVMAFVNVFVPESVCKLPKLGSICFHPSLLPVHRGPSAVNWPIIMGREKSGFTWFYPTDGLDEGDIMLSKECTIEPNDTVIDLYFKKIYPIAVESALEVCDLFREGKNPRIKQQENLATYERRCTKKHALIDWHKPVIQVYNLIRGTNPSPGAWTTFGDAVLSIFDSERVSGDGISGSITEISDAGITIQCIGGRILVKRLKPEGGEKISAGSWSQSVGLKVGDIIGRK